MRRVLVFLLVLALPACSPPTRDRSAAAVATPVTVERAASHPIAGVLEAGGVIQARTTAAIASRVLASVLSVHAVPGDRVRAGQVLVRLDARDLDAERLRAAATADALALGARAAGAERQGAEAAVVLARATHGRIASLHERRSATAHELDEAVAALAGAEARLRSAEAHVAEAEAALEAARSGASAASVTASFATIAAPFDGVVTEKMVEPGNLAVPGTPLLRLEDTRAFHLEVQLDASRAAQLLPGGEVEVLLDRRVAAARDRVSGRVIEVARTVAAGSQSFRVKVELPASPSVRSGTFARIRVPGAARETLAVAPGAIVTRGQLPTVFVVQDGRARMRVISTGEDDGVHVEILGGLAAGEPVITNPPASLRDDDAVTPAPPATRHAADGGR